MEEKVKEYISKQDLKTREIIEQLRKIMIKTLPSISEGMVWGVICYENLYYIAALKDKVNMGFSIIRLSPEEVKLFEGGGKTMRHLSFEKASDINEKKLAQMIKLVKKKAKPVHN